MGNVNISFQNISKKISDILDLITRLSPKLMESSNKSWPTKEILNLLEQKISIPKKFTTWNLKEIKA